MRRNAAVAGFPGLYDFDRQKKVHVTARALGDVYDAGGADETVYGNVVGRVVGIVLARYPVNRRIEMRTRMFPAGDVVPVPGRSALIVVRYLAHGERVGRRERRRQADQIGRAS